MEFAKLAKSARTAAYPSIRKFVEDTAISCTHAHLAEIEKGYVPKLALVLELVEVLKLNKKEALFAWVRDQMPDRETRALFTHFSTTPERSTEQQSVAKSLVVNRMQARLLARNPVYWEILTYLSAHSDVPTPTVSQIAKKFSMPVKEVKALLEDLFDFGMLERRMRAEVEYYAKAWTYIPYEEEFNELREQNFKHAVSKFVSDQSPDKFKTTVTRFLTPPQRKELESAVFALTNHIIDLPDEGIPPGAELCTVGVFSSVRRFGDA